MLLITTILPPECHNIVSSLPRGEIGSECQRLTFSRSKKGEVFWSAGILRDSDSCPEEADMQ